ncbi:MAG: hypothetical protein ACHREM_02565 [Polyangiales bacterium]
MSSRSFLAVSAHGVVLVTFATLVSACSSSSTPASPTDSGVADVATDALVVDTSSDALANTTTIAAARAGNVTTSITVTGVVMAVHGNPGDQSTWYIEDSAGGPGSGIAVYCDPPSAKCPASIRAPALHALVQVTGSITSYNGQLELIPTAQTMIATTTTLPPIPTVTPTDLAAGGSSQYRGVFVKLATTVTVDDLTPAALYDSKCNVATDAGVTDAASADGGSLDAGLPLCTGCAPPTYSGFQANDGAGHEIYVEDDAFFNSEHLASSPECLTATGAVPVAVGKTFSSIQGIVDYDTYAKAQYLAPVLDTDYTMP